MRCPGATTSIVALLTGNYEAGARIKLEYFDLWRYFPCGAFGDEAPNRNGLVPKAIVRVAACGGPAFSAADAVVIGDTPLDVACAAFSGARSMAVATGSHGVEELRAAGADVVFAGSSEDRRRPRGDWLAQREACALRDERSDGGSAWESNPAPPRERGATDFEDREGHRAPFTSTR